MVSSNIKCKLRVLLDAAAHYSWCLTLLDRRPYRLEQEDRAYVAAGCKTSQVSCRRRWCGRGREKSWQDAQYWNWRQLNPAASPFCTNLRRLGFRTMAARLRLCIWTSYMTRVTYALHLFAFGTLPEEEEKGVSAALASVTSPGPWCFRFVAKQLGSLTSWQLSARRVMCGICFPLKIVAVVEEADFTVSALFSWLPQDCYKWHCLCNEIHWDRTSDPLTFICLQKSQPNQTSCSTRPPPWTCREVHKRCDQSPWTVDW